MIKPTEYELQSYFLELACNNPRLESEKFFDYFDSVGWKIGGKAPMKDWKATVRTWVRRIKEREHKVELKKIVETPTRYVSNEPKIEPLECAPPPAEWRKMLQDLANKKGV